MNTYARFFVNPICNRICRGLTSCLDILIVADVLRGGRLAILINIKYYLSNKNTMYLLNRVTVIVTVVSNYQI